MGFGFGSNCSYAWGSFYPSQQRIQNLGPAPVTDPPEALTDFPKELTCLIGPVGLEEVPAKLWFPLSTTLLLLKGLLWVHDRERRELHLLFAVPGHSKTRLTPLLDLAFFNKGEQKVAKRPLHYSSQIPPLPWSPILNSSPGKEPQMVTLTTTTGQRLKNIFSSSS